MKNYVVATLKNKTQIEALISKEYSDHGSSRFLLFASGNYIRTLYIAKVSESDRNFRYILEGLPPIEAGVEYEIQDDKNIFTHVDCSSLMTDWKSNFSRSNEEFGAIYYKDHTFFRLFAPLASDVFLLLFKGEKEESYPMIRDHKLGVFTLDLKGDYDAYEYLYLLKNDGVWKEAMDPFAKSTTLQSRRSVIINQNHIDIDFHDDKLPPLKSPSKAIIYECSVRDFTSSKHSNIINKGKYLGMCEENCKSDNHNPVGIDYLKYLGITHVQLMPVTDFASINDQFIEQTYNWGYDPLNLYAPEGSYSSDPKKPYARVDELKMLISSLHKNGIRVVLDMVFNHMFTVHESSLEKTVPNYFFRFNDDGSYSNGSFCGNEFESRRHMGRKFIVDCCLMYVRDYHVDGFRFDLMGLIDIDTMNEIYRRCKEINNDFILYGEGWDMPSIMPNEQKSKIANAHLLPHIGFFNDRYRDMVKGKTGDSELHLRGYVLGDTNYADAFVHCFLGSCLPIAMPPLFDSPLQSINYVECHDNATLYDKMLYSNGMEIEADRFKRINLLNAVTIFSYGISFIHSGEEIALSKKGITNSYNSGDNINSFDLEILDKRFFMAKYVKEAIELKKEYDFFSYDTKSELQKHIQYENQNGRIIFTILDADPFREVKLIINPLNEPFVITLKDYYRVLFNVSGRITQDFYVNHLTLNNISLIVLALE